MESQAKTGGHAGSPLERGPAPHPSVARPNRHRAAVSDGFRRSFARKYRCGRSRTWLDLTLSLMFSLMTVAAEPMPGGTGRSPTLEAQHARSEAAYLAAREAASASNSVANLWQVGRTAFDLAETTPREKIKAQIAEAGITACRTAVANDPASAPAHYYLALCLGQLAQTKSLGALRLVREIKDEFERVRVLDDALDHAGADRGLGLLYLEAPGWPTSIGDRKLARSHLENAAQLAPDYPDNRLSLAELYLRIKDQRLANAELVSLNALWPKAKDTLTGPAWAQAWIDWENRKKLLESRLQKLVTRK